MQIINLPSPLELQHFFFQEILFQAFPHQDVTQDKVPECDVQYFSSPVTESNKLEITLKVATKTGGDEERHLYRFSLTAVGLFKWNGPLPKDEKMANFNDRLVITGLSILYSGMRDMIRTITSAGPYHPGYILQPISFVPEESVTLKRRKRRIIEERENEVENTRKK